MQFRSHRFPTRYPTQLLAAGRRHDVVILDITDLGAQIHCNLQGNVGDLVHIQVLNTQISGTIIWMRGQITGVKFTRPATKKDIDSVRYRSARNANRHRTVGFAQMR